MMFLLGLLLFVAVSPKNGEELEHDARKPRELGEYIRLAVKGVAILLMLGGATFLLMLAGAVWLFL